MRTLDPERRHGLRFAGALAGIIVAASFGWHPQVVAVAACGSVGWLGAAVVVGLLSADESEADGSGANHPEA